MHLVEWCKNDFCTWGRLVEVKSGSFFYKSLPKYFIKGNINKGEWNLFIENVSYSEAGDYKCKVSSRVEVEKGKEMFLNIESNTASLKILCTLN